MTQPRVFAALKDGPLKVYEIAERTGIPARNVSCALWSLGIRGAVTFTGVGKARRYSANPKTKGIPNRRGLAPGSRRALKEYCTHEARMLGAARQLAKRHISVNRAPSLTDLEMCWRLPTSQPVDDSADTGLNTCAEARP